MRKFTKEHKDLKWLFPDWEISNEDNANGWFKFYEENANQLFEFAHNNKEVFTKDDVIDAFMKGASVAHQRMIDSMSNLGIIKL